MAIVDFLHHENPPTWAGVEPVTLGAEVQRQTNHATQSALEILNFYAKQGAESTQPEVPLTLRRAESIISTSIDKYTAMTQKTKSFRKPWETQATVDPIPRHLERAEAVARFRLTTGHDFLEVYLH
ncbi:uncharacterized protein TNCV_2339201 [Trichonephila clavipes]|nr:uncharacterized protein TNCV_2339201 [Trichonephila clavipes]